MADAEARLRRRLSGSLNVIVRLSGINEAALDAWARQWEPAPGRPGGWNWREQRRRLTATLDRFEVAVWGGDQLCRLAVGKPSNGLSHLNIALLEGNPAPSHPLRGYVAECVVEAAISYGRLLDKRELRLLHPLPGAVPIYRRLGFRVEPAVGTAQYCVMSL